MKVKFFPRKTRSRDTEVYVLSEDMVVIDGVQFIFDKQENYEIDYLRRVASRILSATFKDGVFWIEILRDFSSLNSPSWDTGGWHDYSTFNQ